MYNGGLFHDRRSRTEQEGGRGEINWLRYWRLMEKRKRKNNNFLKKRGVRKKLILRGFFFFPESLTGHAWDHRIADRGYTVHAGDDTHLLLGAIRSLTHLDSPPLRSHPLRLCRLSILTPYALASTSHLVSTPEVIGISPDRSDRV